ncbi:MAG: Gfo/Idh/MocA family oxidoreductase [Acidimicrobiia bacterium]|nr:Gfo/Idh/MocA family oxidoreductase [Acidimicrobiia bacterium]
MHTDENASLPRVAVVGGGRWGQNIVRNAAELGALATICDADGERLETLQQQYGVTTTQDFDTVLSDPLIDAIMLATPAVTHAEMATRALTAGKHVFVEKPLALSLPDAEQLIALADERDLVLMVGHLLWYHPAILELKRLVAEGALGSIQYIYSHRLNFGRFRTEENILWSFAPHDISVILGLLEELPNSVSAHGGSYLNADIADVTVSTLDFPSGARGHVFVSWLHPFRDHRLVVVGDKAMASFEDSPGGGALLFYDHQIAWEASGPIPDRREAREIEYADTEPLRQEIDHFLTCVTEGSRPRTDGPEGRNVLTVLDACQTSLTLGQPMSVNSGVPT